MKRCRLEWALALGWKAVLTDQVAEPFIRAATYHIFAVDGLRIALISGILLGLLKAVGVPRALCGVVAMPLLWFYAAMTGWPASAIRAIVMIMVVFGGWILKRPSDLINSLFAAAIIILVWEPRQLFQAGFQLSFFVVLCILLILPFFKRIGDWVFQADPLRPESLQSRWRKVLIIPGRYLIDLLLASLAAWLGSVPLVAWYFHIFTPLSGPANLLAVPLCGLVLVCDLSSLILGAWLPWPAELFNHAGWFYMDCIRISSQWSANWPGAFFYLPMPGFFTITVYYLILITVLTGWLFKGNRRAWKISGLLLLAGAWCVHWLWELPAIRVTILPLGTGHAVYAHGPGRDNEWLIDCGNESTAESIVKPFLQVSRASNPPAESGREPMASSDFSGGAKSMTELFRPVNIYASPIHFRSPRYAEFLDGVTNNPAGKKPLQIGDQIGCWTVLHPDSKNRLSSAEDVPLVLRGELSGMRILLLSDLSHAGQNALLDRTNDLRSDIVVAGLPNTGEPLSDGLLEAIQPRIIILADADYPASKRAGSKLRERLERRHIPVLCTHETKAVTLTFRPKRWELSALNGARISSTELPVNH